MSDADVIRFTCPNGHKLRVKPAQAGKRFRCPGKDCGVFVVAPAPLTRPETAPEVGDDADDLALSMLMEQEDAVTAKIRELEADDGAVRRRAAKALGATGDARAVGPLIERLAHDTEADVRQIAARALGQLGDGRAVDPLLTATVGDSPVVREGAAHALCALGGPKTIPWLVAALLDQRARFPENARHVLETLDRRLAVDLLTAALRGEDRPEMGAAELARYGGRDLRAQRAAAVLAAIGWTPGTTEETAWAAIADGDFAGIIAGGAAAPRPYVAALRARALYDAGNSEQAVRALHALLETAAREMAADDLTALARMPAVAEIKFIAEIDHVGGGGVQYDYQRTDCSAVTRLANAELARRGMPA